MSRNPGAWPLVVGISGVVVGAGVGFWGGTLIEPLTQAGLDSHQQSTFPLGVVVVGAIIGIGVPLFALGWYLLRRVPITRQPHHTQALWIGLAWGTVAMLIAGGLNGLTNLLPGDWGTGYLNGIFPGLIEEFLKLLLPVILLLSTRTYKSPLLGTWLVFVTAAWLGLIEGISYIISALHPILNGGKVLPDEGFVMMMDVVARILAGVSHPLMTVGAAAIIWLAANSLPTGKAIGVGLLGYLGAAAIHGLNDAVIEGPVRDWSVPISFVVLAVYLVAVFVFWFRPQLLRLETFATTAQGMRSPARQS